MATHAAINEEDKELIKGLERVGFKTRGKGGPGLLYQYFRFAGVSSFMNHSAIGTY